MKWLKFVKLTRGEKALFLQIAGLLLITRIGLLWLPYKWILQKYRRFGSRTAVEDPMPEEQEEYLESVVYLTSAAGRRVLGSRPCLPQAHVVESLLQRRGMDVSLRIGVKKDDENQLLAHAWVEYGGDIVIGGRLSESRYTRLEPLKSQLP